LVTFELTGATAPVSFDIQQILGDTSIVITNGSSTDNAAPFTHQTAFSATVTTTQIKTGTFVCNARDATGRTLQAYVTATLRENT